MKMDLDFCQITKQIQPFVWCGFFFVVPFEVLVAVLVFDLFCFLLGYEKQLT